MLAIAQPTRRRPPPELPAERTRPDGPSAHITCVGRSAQAAPRLVVTAGPRKGAEFVLVEPLTTLGRGSENGVAIADLAVSRRHSRLEKLGASWVVRDQGSGNGTRVNGRRVDVGRLSDGDEIAVGDTRLRFLESDGVLAWRGTAAASGLRGKAHLYGAAAVAVCIVLVAGVLRYDRLRESAEVQARAEAVRAAARESLRESAALARDGKRSEARDALRVAAELDRGDPEIARELQMAEARFPAPAADPGTPGSVAAPVGAPAGTAVSPQPTAGRSVAGTRPIVAAFVEGDLALAVDRAKAVRGRAGRRLAALLEVFAAAHRTGMAEADPARAVRALDEAAEAARAIGGREQGRLAREVGTALAARHLRLARGLSGEDALPRAAAHLRAALRGDPANGEARAEMERVQGQVREIYLRAYLAKDGDPAAAREAFARVGETLPAPDDLGDKARRWLRKLDAKAER